jgi:hypothetical protein
VTFEIADRHHPSHLTDNAMHASEALFCSLPVRADSVAIAYSLEGYRLDVG